ncbi:MAG: hypothetical protein IT376_17685 [Polyangiaceae bacterium]|nr:hypothetical protein [Polyangiaceae bacterium]
MTRTPPIAPAAELPNDNPTLHGGARWLVLDLRSAPVARRPRPTLVRAVPSLAPAPAESPRAPFEAPGLARCAAPPPPPAPAAAPPAEPTATRPFARLVAALGAAVLGAGATRAAACLPGLLDGSRRSLAGLDEAIVRSLVAAGHASGEPAATTDAFVATCAAWRALLDGESEDLEACGPTPLDAWAAGLIAALSGGDPARVKRELRRRGVAAFGLVSAAA